MRLSLNKLLLLVILIALSSGTFLHINSILTLKAKDYEAEAETLLSILGKANESLIEIFERLETKGVIVPEQAITEYHVGLSLADTAISLLTSGNISEANQKIIEAMQKFKDTLRIIYNAIEESLTKVEVDMERIARLKDSISRSFKYVLRLENLAMKANADGFNTTALESKIEDARTFLSDALVNFDRGDIENASSNLVQAEAILDQLMEHLRKLVYNIKVNRIKILFVETENRLIALEERVVSLSNELSPEAKNASLAALNEAEKSLMKAKDLMNKRMINETVSELLNVREKEEEAIEALQSANVTSSNFSMSLKETEEP